MKTWYYLAFYAFLILASGAGTYLKILPESTFLTILTLIVGYHTGLVTPTPGTPPEPVPTSMRPITSNAYIPPDVRATLGVPARASAVQTPTGGNPDFPDAATAVIPTMPKS